MAAKQIPKTAKTKKVSDDKTPQALTAAGTHYTELNRLDKNAKAFLQLEPATQPGVSVQDMLLMELQAARLLNVDMPDEPKQFIHLLETRIREITGSRKNIILILDEESGTYTCLNDDREDNFATSPRELTWISDHYLQDLLGSEQVIHSFLHHQGNIFGIIAIADKLDGTAFNLRDEIVLEQLTQYLSVQVNHYLVLKHSMLLPTIQKTLLKISNRLLSAVDSPAIFHGALDALCTELPFTGGQFIQLDRQTGQGHVLYQLTRQGFDMGNPIREVDQFISLLSLFQSQVWKHTYLYLKGEMLGDKTFSELFGLPAITSVLMLPMYDRDQSLNGALVLFQQHQAANLSKEALKVVEQVSELVTSACGRAKILEKALEIATTDELTGAVNRRGFYTRFEAEVDRARRNQTPMCLAMIDIDHFKSVNDTYGHLSGDIILKEFAALIGQNSRKSDLLCRFGGEEFALMLPETTIHSATELLERLRRKTEKKVFQTPAGNIKVTFSAGINLIETAQELWKEPMQVISEGLARADEALYEAKQLGRNRIVIADE